MAQASVHARTEVNDKAQRLKKNKDKLLEYVRTNVIGHDYEITTPFGVKPLIYSDYTASGKGLYFIEEYI